MPIRRLLASLALAPPLIACAGGEAAAATTSWRPPVTGRVVAPFRYDPRRPYAAPARRGIDLASAPGIAVRAACSGQVTHAGAVPGSWRRGVTVRCGRLVATHLGLATVALRRGTRVRRGPRLGTARGGRVRLGARRVGERHGHVDPAVLLAAPSAPTPLAPATRRRSPRPLEPAPPAAPAPSPAPARAPVRRDAPLVAWAGLVLAALGLPAHGVVARRRRRPARGTALTWRAQPGR